MEVALTLKESLIALADAWCAATGRQLSGLSTLVLKDSKFFGRISGNAGLTVATVERFLAFFREPTNWPDASIPDDVAATLARLPAHEPQTQLEMALP
ncbi:hypothetical protein HY78_14615 [Rhizorhabdus wittichii DC-6]|nr:hypothetical protein HY78_14615 [Rhizorhabdus wittichii DC-6]